MIDRNSYIKLKQTLVMIEMLVLKNTISINGVDQQLEELRSSALTTFDGIMTNFADPTVLREGGLLPIDLSIESRYVAVQVEEVTSRGISYQSDKPDELRELIYDLPCLKSVIDKMQEKVDAKDLIVPVVEDIDNMEKLVEEIAQYVDKWIRTEEPTRATPNGILNLVNSLQRIDFIFDTINECHGG